MKKLKIIILSFVIMLIMVSPVIVQAATPESEILFARLYGTWIIKDSNYPYCITEGYIDGHPYTLRKAYIDGSWLYAYVDFNAYDTGVVPMVIKAWRVKDGGTIYNAFTMKECGNWRAIDNNIFLKMQ